MAENAKVPPGHQSSQDPPEDVDAVMEDTGLAAERRHPGTLRDGPATVGGPVPGGDRPVRKS